MLTMVHSNSASLEKGIFRVDRKFHIGMQNYLQGITEPILSIHPLQATGDVVMDAVEVPCTELGYEVMCVKTDKWMRPLPRERDRMRAEIQRSKLVYGGSLGSAELSAQLAIPYILVLEYDLQTEIFVTTSQVSGKLRRGARAVHTALRFARSIPVIHGANQVHCNGYPVFDQSRWLNKERLLYLDSRMSADSVIPLDELQKRFANRARRPLRLLYSGRYEPMKGATDAVQVGLACIRRGIDIELHCYGQGSLRDEMRRLAVQAPKTGQIVIHDAVPFPDLVLLSRTFDIFLCCHLQNDPSCTYLESMGSGLPIVGYGNRMWRRLAEVSDAGLWSASGNPEGVADAVQKLHGDTQTLDMVSTRARGFAMDHAFEREFALRVDSINSVLGRARPPTEARSA